MSMTLQMQYKVFQNIILLSLGSRCCPFTHPTPLHSLQGVVHGIPCFLQVHRFETHPVLQEQRMIIIIIIIIIFI